jgi:hypothetical protein
MLPHCPNVALFCFTHSKNPLFTSLAKSSLFQIKHKKYLIYSTQIHLYIVRASPTHVQQKFANEQDGTKRIFFVVAGRHAKVLK